ncbi:glycerol-3-phosphate acyltransferase [Phormidium sp. CCY1219]|uniref:glycerol-3-phosphate acyltransferase n=1 Tax=Phormidium sp. CCY1219 TaxID=2886104 RepID=UPI002D1F42AE|nr:glycerol-3-phosphate acyltransferase [Phormidium sp. CCY1219]MEB3827497.1 glycerol-3-phosphate acyltransferase [Phormidium sp. CCY1219]
MTLTQVWGSVLIFTVCPILGGLPLIAWIVRALTGQDLGGMGTGNIGVSAAFYHGGRWVGILAVLSEALKGIAAVLLAQHFFPQNPEWDLIALIALVTGRYWIGKGAGTTNVVWGFVVHDPIAAGLIFLIAGISFTLVRERQQGRNLVLVLIPAITAALHSQQLERIGAAIALSVLLYWIYQKMPDDLDLPAAQSNPQSQKLFRFFRGDRAILCLDKELDPTQVGQKAARLSQLKRQGYPVPQGWVLPAGDDPTPLSAYLQPSPETPLIVRSSAVGEDTENASAAGQYATILNVTSRQGLEQAITSCLQSYEASTAATYRRDRQVRDDAIAVLIQPQIRGVFSGVAFSRDPIMGHGERVSIEALPGECTRVVSGQVTPERYQVYVRSEDVEQEGSWVLPAQMQLSVEGTGEVPPILLEQVAYLARHLENGDRGIPQDIEWTYDGENLWLLQSRPITTLLPIWTRKIASEVIPGTIRPLTWSINRPLTCGVWGKLFTIVLGKRSRNLNFEQTATLHFSRAYFNASLLGQIFLRMGLPPESLEFLTRGASFSKPPMRSTFTNLRGLLRLFSRELRLSQDFEEADRKRFSPTLAELANSDLNNASQTSGVNEPAATRMFLNVEKTPKAILGRIDRILDLLEEATYYSILAPLSFLARQAVLKVNANELDYSQMPEVSAVRSLQELANEALLMLPDLEEISLPGDKTGDCSQLFAVLAEMPDGQTIFEQLDEFLETFGYLSDVATDIAVPTWKEDPRPVRQLFTQQLFQPSAVEQQSNSSGMKAQWVQPRLNLKGRVSAIYSQLLAHLRWSFLALEQVWLDAEVLSEAGDIFFLEFEEIRQMIEVADPPFMDRVGELVASRRRDFARDEQLVSVPSVVYGHTPGVPSTVAPQSFSGQQLRGIGASAGVAEGPVKVIRSLQSASAIAENTIVVVPYTDAGWGPLLARANGLISEVGGQLSHGAIVAREYGIPAVMDVADATQTLQEGQWVRIDGQRGIVEIL